MHGLKQQQQQNLLFSRLHLDYCKVHQHHSLSDILLIYFHIKIIGCGVNAFPYV